MKITEETTLAQLAIERAKLGVTYVSLAVPRAPHMVAMLSIGTDRYVFGTGATVAEALDAAFTKLRDDLAAQS